MRSTISKWVWLLIGSLLFPFEAGAAPTFSIDIRSAVYADGTGVYTFDSANGFEISNGPLFARLQGTTGSQIVDGAYRVSVPLATPALPDPPGASLGIDANGLFGTVPGPEEWRWSATLTNITAQNAGTLYEARVGVVGGGAGARIRARWLTGRDGSGPYYSNALILHTRIGAQNGYVWDSAAQDGGPGDVFLVDVNPMDTVLELMVDATEGGRTVGTYYRLDGEADWHLAHMHSLPDGLGPIYGFASAFPSIVATNDALAVPEPSSFLLFFSGLSVLGIGAHLIRNRRMHGIG